MSDHKANTGQSGGDSSRNLAEMRAPRTIRFSDSEWKRIDKLAVGQGISSADLVRQTMIAMTGGKLPAWFDAASAEIFGQSDSISPELVERIRHIDRGVFILATLKRNEMLREGRREELDEIVQEAKQLQNNADKKLSK